MKAIILIGTLLASLSTNAYANSGLDSELQRLFKLNDVKPLKWPSRDLRSPKYQLGAMLFSDPILSGNQNISCLTCHDPSHGGGDALPLPIGEGGTGIGPDREMGTGSIVARHSPALVNIGYANVSHLFYDGRVSYNKEDKTFQTPVKQLNGKNPLRKDYTNVLENAMAAQSMFPVFDHIEMRGRPLSNDVANTDDPFKAWDLVMQRILKVDRYKKLLKKIYPATTQFNFAHVANALGHFQSQFFLALNTPFDKYLRGNQKAMSESEKRGAIVFYTRGKCASCHSGSHLSDFDFHNTAFPQIGPGKEKSGDDKGRYYITQLKQDMYKFRTPALRNVAKTAPYGHSGSLESLKRVIEHYEMPMRSNHHYVQNFKDLPYQLDIEWNFMNDRLRSMDPLMPRRNFLTEQEKADLLKFLEISLTEVR